jgi:predicted metalloprotease with PDZ domain
MYSKRILIFLLFTVTLSAAHAQKKEAGYQYTIDLTKVVDDKVYVELATPPISKPEIVFFLPKIIPGTYSIEDYGRFVSKFTALDKKGNKLQADKRDDNSWIIKNATKLAKISYWVDDSWDTEIAGPDIFEPAGTNIEEGKNFILNTAGFFGYFEGIKEVPFTFNVVRPESFYGSTGLIATQTGKPSASVKLENFTADKTKLVDTYKAVDYDQLVDSPLMYAKPDTAVVKVANTEVLIGSYSPNGKINAKEIAESIRELLMAQKEYLGGTLPVEKYAFIFYFTDNTEGKGFGALEHSYSSVYHMPEATMQQLRKHILDVAAHEFFHIVTPLTVHSKEIENFDFNNPKMSMHLWMYEGCTEYFAGNVQVKYGLIDINEYIDMLREKMVLADKYKDNVPFTDISKYTLEQYKDQYENVYQKGALIGMCLDIKLRKLSKGKYGLRNLLLDLSKKYGKNKAFDDNELFGEIVKLTYPEIGEFLNKYVNGPEPLPFQEVLADVGILYTKEEKFEDYSLGLSQENIGVEEIDGKPHLIIASTENMNAMGKALAFKEGDVIVKINGETLPDLGPEFQNFIGRQIQSLPTLQKLSFTVLRKDESGAAKEIELAAPVQKIEIIERHVMQPNPDATPEQVALRESWLKP